jgi:hypothetical protein
MRWLFPKLSSREPSFGVACCFYGSDKHPQLSQRKSAMLTHGQGGGHVSPSRELCGNLGLPQSN